MKKYMLLISFCLSAGVFSFGQIPVTDAANLSQSLANFAQHLAVAGNTYEGVIETKRIYEMSRQYYDALQSVHSLVRSGRKVQECALISAQIVEDYNRTLQEIVEENYFTPLQLATYNLQQSVLMKGVANVIADMGKIIVKTGLSLTDKERMDAIDTYHRRLIGLYHKSCGVNYQMVGEIRRMKKRKEIRALERELLR